MNHVSLGELTHVVSKGTTPSSIGLSFAVTGIPFLKGEDVLGKEIDFSVANTFISEASHHVLNRSALEYGDVLITIAGTIGRVGYIAQRNRVANCNQAVAFARPNLEKIDPEWLCYLLQSSTYQAKFAEFVAGGAIPNVNLQQIRSLEIPSIDIQEQRQITVRLKAQLAEVKTARQSAQVQLREAAALKTKALESLFSNIANWEPIGNATKLQSGYAFKSDNFKTSGARLLRNANILPGKVYWDDAVFLSESDSVKYPSYVLSTGDVLISLDRPIISSGIKVARVGADDLPALLVQRVGRFLIDPQRLDADYFYAYLQTDLFISKISGHEQSLGVPHISPSQVEAIEMPLPDISVQRELSKRLNDVTHTWQVAVAAMQSQVNDLSKLPKAILAQAFDK